MKTEIEAFKPLADGFVFGILNADSRVDVVRNQELVALASPRPCTFHRAIDEVDNLLLAVDDVVRCGFASILTSGGEPDAVAGGPEIAAMVRHADGRVSIIAGGGVRASNIVGLKEIANVDWFHSSALVDSSGVASSDEVRKLVGHLQATK